MLTHFADGTPVPMTATVDGKFISALTREELETAFLRLLREHEELWKREMERTRSLDG